MHIRPFGRVPFLERVLFLKHLSVLIGSGASLPESLTLLQNQARSRRMRRNIISLTRAVAGGKHFSDALEEIDIFSPFVIRLVRAGEASGRLEEELKHLSLQLTKDMEIRRKVRSALLYPAFILTAAIALGGWIGFFILPRLSRVFLSLAIPLPLPTRILLWFSRQLSENGIWIAAGTLASIILVAFLLRMERVKPIWQRAALSLPLLGVFVQNVSLARLTRMLGSLLRGGIPIGEALTLSAESSSNVLYRRALFSVRDSVMQGNAIGKSVERHPALFPPVLTNMVTIGERSGSLEGLFFYLADYYEEEVDATARNFSTVIEPLLIILLGFFVAWIGLSIVLPIAQLYGSLAG